MPYCKRKTRSLYIWHTCLSTLSTSAPSMGLLIAGSVLSRPTLATLVATELDSPRPEEMEVADQEISIRVGNT